MVSNNAFFPGQSDYHLRDLAFCAENVTKFISRLRSWREWKESCESCTSCVAIRTLAKQLARIDSESLALFTVCLIFVCFAFLKTVHEHEGQLRILLEIWYGIRYTVCTKSCMCIAHIYDFRSFRRRSGRKAGNGIHSSTKQVLLKYWHWQAVRNNATVRKPKLIRD
jgi:hypothetical protein